MHDAFKAQHVSLMLGRGTPGWVGEGYFLEIGTPNAKLRHYPLDSGEQDQMWFRGGSAHKTAEVKGKVLSAIPALWYLQFESNPICPGCSSSQKPSMTALAPSSLCHLPSTA